MEEFISEDKSQQGFKPRYPALEQLVDSEDFEQINKNYGAVYDELEKISKQKGLGKAREAKKAMKGLERVMDLLKTLLKLKYEYIASHTKDGESSPQKKKSGDAQLQGTRTR